MNKEMLSFVDHCNNYKFIFTIQTMAMVKRIFTFLFLLCVTQSFAGHHFETALAKQYPNFDLTDLFVFESAQKDKTVLIMAFNPQTKEGEESNYSSQGIYRFCIGGDKDFTSGISPAFMFNNGEIEFYWSAMPEPSLDVKGKLVAKGPINRILELDNGARLFAGTVKDLFAGNSKGIGKFRRDMAEGVFDISAFDVGEEGDVFSTLLSTVIVIEIPNEYLPEQMHYYAATAIEAEPDHWHRVNRIAQVLFPHTYLLDVEMKEKYLNADHRSEPDVKQAVRENVLKYVTAAGFQKDPIAYTDSLLHIIYPDVMQYEVGSKASYTLAKRNGRPLQADAMNITMALLMGLDSPFDDQVAVKLNRYQSVFPYCIPIEKDFIAAAEKVVQVNTMNPIESQQETRIKEDGSQKINYFLIGLIGVAAVMFLLLRRK